MHSPSDPPTEPFERAAKPAEQLTSNPLAKGLNVSVSVPETLEIVMVDASALGEYEVWLFLASLLWSGVVGCFVAFLQTDTQNPIKWMLLGNTILFAVVFVVMIVTAMMKRKRLKKKAKRIDLRVTDAGTA